MTPRPIIAAIAGIALGSCAADRQAPTEFRLLAMGTWVDVTIEEPHSDHAADAIAAIERMLRDFERDYYAWGDGELARLNAALAAGMEFQASPELAALIATARALSLASDRAFDPGVGRLIELWGFHDAAAASGSPPDAGSIAGLLANGIGIASVTVDGDRVASTSTATLIDLGGIAKGKAVDKIIDLLLRHQIADAMVNAGGDLRVIGAPVGRRWRIGIQSPRSDSVLATVELGSGDAAFTSGDYERFYERDGERWHHLLDPATGYPATHTQAVTVIGKDGVTADAAATAIFVAGPERWPAVARELGIELVLRVDASGLIEATPKMRDRLQISADNTSDIISVRQ